MQSQSKSALFCHPAWQTYRARPLTADTQCAAAPCPPATARPFTVGDPFLSYEGSRVKAPQRPAVANQTRFARDESRKHLWNREPKPPKAPEGEADGEKGYEYYRQRTNWQQLQEAKPVAIAPVTPDEHAQWMRNWKAQTHRHHNAALRIQLAWKCWRAKRRVHVFRTARHAVLQKLLEAERVRQMVWTVDQERRRELEAPALAAGKLQSWWRMVSQRKRYREMRGSHDAAVAQRARNYAATRIQAQARGFLVRQRKWIAQHPEVVQQRAERLRNKRATRIQRVFRGYIARKRFEARKQAVCTIQQGYRGHLSMKHRKERQRLAEERVQSEKEHYAARVIQRNVRGYIHGVSEQRRTLKQQKVSATKLQAWWRGAMTRKWMRRPISSQPLPSTIAEIPIPSLRRIAPMLHDHQRKEMYRGPRFDAAARRLQSFFKIIVVMRHSRRRKKHIVNMLNTADLAYYNHKAEVIQSFFKYIKERKAWRNKWKAVRNEEGKRQYAAEKIQGLYRMRQSREFSRAARAALAEQLEHAERDDAAFIIQAGFKRSRAVRGLLAAPRRAFAPGPAPDDAEGLAQDPG